MHLNTYQTYYRYWVYIPQKTLRSALDITHLNVPITNKVLGQKLL